MTRYARRRPPERRDPPKRKRSKAPVEVLEYGVWVDGEVVRARLPVHVEGTVNANRGWRGGASKSKAQREAVRAIIGTRIRCIEHPLTEYAVTFTRVAPGTLDDDNLVSAFKACRDEVAALMGRDDKPGSGVHWRYAQRKGPPRTYAIEIEVRRLTPEDRCPHCHQIMIERGATA